MLKKTLKINGVNRIVVAASDASLADVLREQLGLTGTKVGCGEGQCGACNVILDGKLVRSCITKMAKVVDGAAITTIEGSEHRKTSIPFNWPGRSMGERSAGSARPALLFPARRFWMKHRTPPARMCVAGFRCIATPAAVPVITSWWTR